MLQSLIPGVSRVSLWVVFCVGILCGPSTAFLLAQTPKPAPDAPADDSPESDGDEQMGLVDTQKAKTGGLEERFRDPNAAAALENTFPELFPRAVTTEAMIVRMEKAVNAMANGGTVDRVQVVNYLQSQAAIMTKHSNIAAVLDPESSSKAVNDMEAAGARLRHPLDLANERSNTGFRQIYTESLLSISGDLLKNHLFARIWTMEALSRSMEDSTIPLFIKQLDDADQVLSVKLLAALGLTRLAGQGTRDLGAQSAKAAQSVANFLDRQPDTFWPVQYRMLEALGSLRTSTISPTQPKGEFAETALRFLSNRNAAPATRAWAGWALGMMRPLNPQYNFALVAYHDGLAVADIGEEILNVRSKNPQRALRLTEFLVPLHQSFVGIGPRAANSGLLNAANPSLNAQKSKITAIEGLVRDVLARAIELSQAAGSQLKDREAALKASLTALRNGLKTPPEELALIPGGETFPPP